MSNHYANVAMPTWGLGIAHVADVVQFIGRSNETREEHGLLRIAGDFAPAGSLPSELVQALHGHEVPYDFFIEHVSGLRMDQRGYWRPGMDEPRTWFEIDGLAFVWVSLIRGTLARGTVGQSLQAVAAQLDEAEPAVPDLRAFPHPRLKRADDLRSGIHLSSVMSSLRRRLKL